MNKNQNILGDADVTIPKTLTSIRSSLGACGKGGGVRVALHEFKSGFRNWETVLRASAKALVNSFPFLVGFGPLYGVYKQQNSRAKRRKQVCHQWYERKRHLWI